MNPDPPCVKTKVCTGPEWVGSVWRAAIWGPHFGFDILGPSSPKYRQGKIIWSIYRSWLFSGVPTGKGLVMIRPTTAGIVHWYVVLATWNLDTPVCGTHQSYHDPTLDISTHPRVRFLPICCKAYGYNFQVSLRLQTE